VERSVDRRSAGELARGQATHHLLESEGILADQCGVLLDECARRLGALLVPLDGRALAVPRRSAVPELDDDDIRRVLRPARDPERLGEPKRDDPGRDLHRG